MPARRQQVLVTQRGPLLVFGRHRHAGNRADHIGHAHLARQAQVGFVKGAGNHGQSHDDSFSSVGL